jgi:DeoR/GlpR family transcriptional regulator of sugar metabolism
MVTMAMFGAERRHVILELLRVNGALSVRDLAATLDVTTVTVRRDLETLVKRGEVERRHGGVALLGIDAGDVVVLGQDATVPRTMMFGAERRQLILTLLRANGMMSLGDLSAAVNSSDVTTRRDLSILEKRGFIRREFGGAVVVGELETGLLSDAPFRRLAGTVRDSVQLGAKRAMALLAAEMVCDGDALVLGSGTTIEALARQVASTANLTVLTHSMLVMRALATSPGVQVVVASGSLDQKTMAIVGPEAEQAIGEHRAQRAFISGQGVSIERGVSTGHSRSSAVDRMIARSVDELVVLADSSKLGVESTYQTAPPEQISHLITDSAADPRVLDGLRARGVIVHIAA